ncbi:MAG: NTP transferase domain-containing protein [Ignavibacteria bacterium]|nr:NTP transferase domain-containing protein [Ignavibacteria bacterium]
MKGMILAAGFGTRLRPLTDTKPKALVSYKGKPLVVHQIRRLMSAGITEIVINAHHFSEQVVEFFMQNRFDADISVIVENEILGTGGGILNASDHLRGSDFAVVNVDVETDMNLSDMIIEHRSRKPLATLAVQKRRSGRYLEFSPEMKLMRRAADDSAKDRLFAFNGIHVVSDEFLSLGFGSGFSDILDLYFRAIESGKTITGYDAGECSFRDLGKTENLLS